MAENNKDKIVSEEGGKQSVIPAIIVTLILGAVGGAFASDYFDELSSTSSENAAHNVKTGSNETTKIATKTSYDLGDFSLNLKDASALRTLQMNIAVSCDAKSTDSLEVHHAQIRDAIIMFTSEQTADSLLSLEGKMAFRDELLMRINAILKPERAQGIYFTQFVIES